MGMPGMDTRGPDKISTLAASELAALLPKSAAFCTYTHSGQQETLALLPEDTQIQLGSAELPGYTDVNGQLLDFRKSNTWVTKMQDVETPELCETFLINTMSPFVMNGRLKHVLERSPRKRKFIVNVSAMEGKFSKFKSPNHPHTNMAKAALNMMTKTSARDYASAGIYMNSIDTGWINDEKPLHQAFQHAQDTKFQTPIDEIDAAARVLDPVMMFLETHAGDVKSCLYWERRRKVEADIAASDGDKSRLHEELGPWKWPEPPFGKFLKDYHVTEW